MNVLGITAQRWLLGATAALVAIVYTSSAADPVNLPKLAVTAVAAIAILAVGLVRVIVLRRFVLPTSPALIAAAVLLLGLVAATVRSDVPGLSYAGGLGRSDGLLLYAACLLCFAAVIRVYDADSLRLLVFGLLCGGVFLASYGLLQSVGVDGVGWADIGLSPIIGTLGNPDFEAAYVGIMMPLAGWGVATRTWSLAWRIPSAVLLLGCVTVAVVSSSSQGLLAGAAGVFVLGVALVLQRGDRIGRLGLYVLGAGAALIGFLVLAGVVLGVGPGRRVVGASSLTARHWYWSSAVDMWRAHPVTGVGPERYGAYYRSVRPAAAAAASNYSDAAHSVPLQMLSTGGLLVAIPYAVVVLLVGWALVRGLRRLAGEERLLLGAVGGAWLAYQVQALVSIDEPALAVTHWLLAGAVVVLGAPPRHVERLLPGAVVAAPPRGRKVPLPTRPLANWSAASVVLVGVVSVISLLLVWQALTPLRAARASRDAAVQLAAGNGNATLDRLNAAVRLAPYEDAYWLQRGQLLEQVRQPDQAAAAYATGLGHDPRSYDLLLAAARLAKKQGDTAALAKWTAGLRRVDVSGGWRSSVTG